LKATRIFGSPRPNATGNTGASKLNPAARKVLRAILEAQLADPTAWVLRADGVFERLQGDGPTSQEVFMADAGQSADAR